MIFLMIQEAGPLLADLLLYKCCQVKLRLCRQVYLLHAISYSQQSCSLACKIHPCRQVNFLHAISFSQRIESGRIIDHEIIHLLLRKSFVQKTGQEIVFQPVPARPAAILGVMGLFAHIIAEHDLLAEAVLA